MTPARKPHIYRDIVCEIAFWCVRLRPDRPADRFYCFPTLKEALSCAKMMAQITIGAPASTGPVR